MKFPRYFPSLFSGPARATFCVPEHAPPLIRFRRLRMIIERAHEAQRRKPRLLDALVRRTRLDRETQTLLTAVKLDLCSSRDSNENANAL